MNSASFWALYIDLLFLEWWEVLVALIDFIDFIDFVSGRGLNLLLSDWVIILSFSSTLVLTVLVLLFFLTLRAFSLVLAGFLFFFS